MTALKISVFCAKPDVDRWFFIYLTAQRSEPSGGFRFGGPEARLKKWALWWRHRTQPTV